MWRFNYFCALSGVVIVMCVTYHLFSPFVVLPIYVYIVTISILSFFLINCAKKFRPTCDLHTLDKCKDLFKGLLGTF